MSATASHAHTRVTRAWGKEVAPRMVFYNWADVSSDHPPFDLPSDNLEAEACRSEGNGPLDTKARLCSTG